MKQYVYLCGRITGASYLDARYGWRHDVFQEFSDDPEIVPLSPMRCKQEPQGAEDAASLSPLGDPTTILSNERGLTTRDRFDVFRSSILFANLLGFDRISAGCMIEFGWADALRIPILCVMEDDNPHQHAMVRQLTGWRCTTLEQGIDTLRKILSEGL